MYPPLSGLAGAKMLRSCRTSSSHSAGVGSMVLRPKSMNQTCVNGKHVRIDGTYIIVAVVQAMRSSA